CSFLSPLRPGDALILSAVPSTAVTDVSLNCILPPMCRNLRPAPATSPATPAPFAMITLCPTLNSCAAWKRIGVPGSTLAGMSAASVIATGKPPITPMDCVAAGTVRAGAAGGGALTEGGGATATGAATGGGSDTGADGATGGDVTAGTCAALLLGTGSAFAALGLRIASSTCLG